MRLDTMHLMVTELLVPMVPMAWSFFKIKDIDGTIRQQKMHDEDKDGLLRYETYDHQCVPAGAVLVDEVHREVHMDGQEGEQVAEVQFAVLSVYYQKAFQSLCQFVAKGAIAGGDGSDFGCC